MKLSMDKLGEHLKSIQSEASLALTHAADDNHSRLDDVQENLMNIGWALRMATYEVSRLEEE